MASKDNYLGSAIKFHREAHCLTQTQLAKKIGVSQRNVSYYESGEHVPPADILKKLAEIFGISVDMLLGNVSLLGEPPANTNLGVGRMAFFFDDSLKNIFVKRINEALSEKGVTEERLSEATDIEITACSAYLKGDCKPPIEHLINISNVLCISIDYLLGQIDYQEEKALSSFKLLNDDNKDICIGEIKRSLRDQRREESGSVAADPLLKKAN